MKTVQKIINDTLKTPKGKWSMKRLIIGLNMFFIITLASFIVISDLILDVELNRYAVDVFDGMLLFEMGLLGLSEAGKKFRNKIEQPDETNVPLEEMKEA